MRLLFDVSLSLLQNRDPNRKKKLVWKGGELWRSKSQSSRVGLVWSGMGKVLDGDGQSGQAGFCLAPKIENGKIDPSLRTTSF